MLERKDLPAPVKPAAVVDQVIIIGFEHIYLDLRQVEFLKLNQAVISFIEYPALPFRDDVPLAAVLLLALLVSYVVGRSDLGIIVHILGPKLHLGKTSGLVIVKGYMHRSVAGRARCINIIPVIGTHHEIAQFIEWRYYEGIEFFLLGYEKHREYHEFVKDINRIYLEEKAFGECNIELPYQVPESKVFVMGDNRSVSIDSRNTAVGCVAEEQIVGKVVYRLWPLKEFGKLR